MMPELSERLRRVRKLAPGLRLGGLAEALAGSDQQEAGVIASVLLEEAHLLTGGRSWWGGGIEREQVVGALTAVWHRIPPELRPAGEVTFGGELAAEAERLVGSERARDRLAGVALAEDLESAGAIRALAGLLRDGERDIAEAAEGALGRMMRRAGEMDPEAARAVDEALAAAGRGFVEHRRRGMMKTIAVAAARGWGAVGEFVGEADGPGHMALRAAAKRSNDREVRESSVRWLGVEALAPAALAQLERLCDEQEERALTQGVLLMRARRRTRLDGSAPARRLVEKGVRGELNQGARRGLVEWIAAGERTGRVEKLASFLTDDSARVRFAALRRCAELARDDEEACSLLEDFAFDADACVARTAVSALLAQGRLRKKIVRALVRSPHESVRTVAVGEARDWRDAIRNPGAEGRGALALRRALDDSQTRSAAINTLRSAIARGEAPARIRAIRLARRVGAAAECELELLGAAAGDDARVAATAARALGGLSSSSALEALAKCAQHGDGRVRASAIEAAGREETLDSIVIEAMDEPCARARANAVRVMLKKEGSGGHASEALAAMLTDSRADHRVSGLWAAQRLGRTELAQRVAGLATEEGEGPVREGARRCGKRLLAQLRSEWSSESDTCSTAPKPKEVVL